MNTFTILQQLNHPSIILYLNNKQMLNMLTMNTNNSFQNKISSLDYLNNYTYLEYVLFPQLFQIYIKQLPANSIISLFCSYSSILREFVPQLEAFQQQSRSQLLLKLLKFAIIDQSKQKCGQNIQESHQHQIHQGSRQVQIAEQQSNISQYNMKDQKRDDVLSIKYGSKIYFYSKSKLAQLSDTLLSLHQKINIASDIFSQNNFSQCYQTLQKQLNFLDKLLLQSQNAIEIKNLINKKTVSRGLIYLLSLIIQQLINMQNNYQLNYSTMEKDTNDTNAISFLEVFDSSTPIYIYYQCAQLLKCKYMNQLNSIKKSQYPNKNQQLWKIQRMLVHIQCIPIWIQFKQLQTLTSSWQSKTNYFNSIKSETWTSFNFYWIYLLALSNLSQVYSLKNQTVKSLPDILIDISKIYSVNLTQVCSNYYTEKVWQAVLYKKKHSQKNQFILKSLQNSISVQKKIGCQKVISSVKQLNLQNNKEKSDIMIEQQFIQEIRQEDCFQQTRVSSFLYLFYSIMKKQLRANDQRSLNLIDISINKMMVQLNQNIKVIVLQYKCLSLQQIYYKKQINSVQNKICLFLEQLNQISQKLSINQNQQLNSIQNLCKKIYKTKQNLYIYLITLQNLQYTSYQDSFNNIQNRNDYQIFLNNQKPQLLKFKQVKKMFNQILHFGSGNPSLEVVTYFISSVLSLTNFNWTKKQVFQKGSLVCFQFLKDNNLVKKGQKQISLIQGQIQYQKQYIKISLQLLQMIHTFLGQIIRHFSDSKIIIEKNQLKYVNMIIAMYQLVRQQNNYFLKIKELSQSQKQNQNIFRQIEQIQTGILDRLVSSEQFISLINSQLILEQVIHVILLIKIDDFQLNNRKLPQQTNQNNMEAEINQQLVITIKDINEFHISKKLSNKFKRQELFSKYALSKFKMKSQQKRKNYDAGLLVKIIQKYVHLSRFGCLNQVEFKISLKNESIQNRLNAENFQQNIFDFSMIKQTCRISFLNFLVQLLKIKSSIQYLLMSKQRQIKPNQNQSQNINQLNRIKDQINQLQIKYLKELKNICKLKWQYYNSLKNQPQNYEYYFLDFFQQIFLHYIIKLKQLKTKLNIFFMVLNSQRVQELCVLNNCQLIQIMILLNLSKISQIDYQFMEQKFSSKVINKSNRFSELQRCFSTYQIQSIQFHFDFVQQTDLVQYIYQYFPIKINNPQQESKLYDIVMKWNQDSRNHQWLSIAKGDKFRQQKLADYIKYILQRNIGNKHNIK